MLTLLIKEAKEWIPMKIAKSIIQVETRNPAIKRNVGASLARGSVLAFIDDDALAPDDWLEKGLLKLPHRYFLLQRSRT